jgi:UDP-2,3-diacylglucosamine hydrolase
MKKAIFIADSHLKSPSSPEYVDFINFIDNTVLPDDELEALFILGDLFDFFMAFPRVIFYEHMEVLSRLNKLAVRGVKVFYFEGNHDFFLKKINKEGFPANIVERHMYVQLDGKYYVSHGDMANKKDYSHRIMSAVVKNPVTYFLAYTLPPYLLYELAHLFSRFSRKNISSKRTFSENILTDFINGQINLGCDGAILGHFHKNMTIEKKSNDKIFTLHLLGSWKYDRSYLVFENGCFCSGVFYEKQTAS